MEKLKLIFIFIGLINQSIFTYPVGQTSEDYVDRNFRPLFLDKTSAKYNEAKKICGESNLACIYDFIATDNKELAQETKLVAERAEEQLEQSSNFFFFIFYCIFKFHN